MNDDPLIGHQATALLSCTCIGTSVGSSTAKLLVGSNPAAQWSHLDDGETIVASGMCALEPVENRSSFTTKAVATDPRYSLNFHTSGLVPRENSN